MTGGVYAVGALRALDLLAVNMDVNQFDVYLGTSSGSFVAALVANGVTTEEMMRVVLGERPAAFHELDAGTLLQPNLPGLLRSGLGLPRHLLELAYQVATARGGGSLIDALFSLRRLAAVGLRHDPRDRALPAGGVRRPRAQRRLPQARARALHRRDRSRQLRADRLRRAGLRRRRDLARGQRLDRAAGALRAGARSASAS